MAEGAPAEGEAQKASEDTKKIVHTYPLVRHSDMPEDTKAEAIDLVVTACEKFSSNNEVRKTYISQPTI
ncbi:hypothetical protein NQ318_009462 [Aromia moschata]|uniref:Dynein light chain n=1 Tax=Aromia moschata TaxID=1265417 RepID=A0AAV8Z787_9CUCU|nr:hypothetical protein NQ318_009462 [Aromia moschata]